MGRKSSDVAHLVLYDLNRPRATFAADGPEPCSDLLTVRYTPEGLAAEFGAAFRLVESIAEAHQTPWQAIQNFIYCRLQRIVS